MDTRLRSRRLSTIVPIALIAVLVATPAHAQQVGVRGGITTTPAFAFGGLQIEGPPIHQLVSLRGTIAAARGRQSGIILSFGFAVRPLMNRTNWSPYFGIAPTFVVARTGGRPGRYDSIGSGLGVFVGAERRHHLSIEVQLNIQRDQLPRLFASVGYRFF